MAATVAQNIQKYQGVASPQIVSAVSKAAKATGVDFTFLMEKAATESSFNPKAKAKSSSATGLFQFIEQTWLNTVKKHGDKHGLGQYADKIEIKNGKAVVTDAKAKQEILNLRKDAEISSLMAGEFCSDNQDYLETNTRCDVGATELYLAHFMGAGGAAKFLNSRDVNGAAIAASLFPKAAAANKSIFYERGTNRALSLNEIYDKFANKFTDGTISPSTTALPSPSTAVSGSVPAPASATSLTPLDLAAQALPSFDDDNEADDIIWNDDPRFQHSVSSGFGNPKNPLQRLSPINIMVMTQVQETVLNSLNESRRYNS